MKRFTLLITGFLSACASAPESQNPAFYKKSEIALVVASHFDASTTDISRALQPSFNKFGTPKRYVSGRMSSVDNEVLQRLYGSGEVHQRLGLKTGVFWQIEGEALAGHFSPIRTVHLVYDKLELTGSSFKVANLDVRRGKTFTVFEREYDGRIIVSLYPTDELSPSADFKELMFEAN